MTNRSSTAPRSASSPATLALLFASVLLASCGGGGGDAPAPASAVAPTPPAVAAPAPAATPTTSTCGLANFAASALALVNQKRAAGATCGIHGAFAPAGPLAWNALLNQAADGHSSDMAAKNYFSHTSADGRLLSDRIDATGYLWSTIGENIAAGYPTVQAVVDGWMASDGHCQNIMTAAFTEIGLSCVPGTAASSFSNYWTMDLARPR